MKNNVNIAIVGLGQIGIYLYNELNIKKKDIEIKTGKNKIVAISAKNRNKKEDFQYLKKFFIKILYKFFRKKKLIYYSNVLDYQMVFQKKLLKQH